MGMFLSGCSLPMGPIGRSSEDCSDCNVLWIVVDTMRADRLAANGGDPAILPALNEAAANGTIWQQAWSQAPTTMLSVTSYFSGRHRSNHGQMFRLGRRDRFQSLHPSVTTVAEVMRSEGFKTVGLIGNPVLAPRSQDARMKLDLEQGFDQWVSLDDKQVAERGVDFLATHQEGRFLLYLHLLGPHVTNQRLYGFVERRGVQKERLGDANAELYRHINQGQLAVDAADLAYLNALYDDALWRADGKIRQVLEQLEASGLDERTLVVFTSDHGEVLGDYSDPHPVFGHGMALNQELLNVPLFMTGPGVPAGEVQSSRVVELLDIAPTLADVLDIPVDPAWRWEGESLLSGDPGEDVALSDMGGHKNRHSGARNRTHVVRYDHVSSGTFYTTSEAERASVPPEEEHRQLEALLQTHLAEAVAPTGAVQTGAPEGVQREALKALGYLE